MTETPDLMQTLRIRPAPKTSGLDWRPMRITPTGSLLVACRIGETALTGLIDTGASITLVDPQRLGTIGRGAGGPVKVTADWGARTLFPAAPLAITVTDRALRIPRPLFADLSVLSATGGEVVDVIIGQDVLAQGMLLLDFEAGRIAFPSAAPDLPQRWRQIDLRSGPDGRLCLPVRLDGGPPALAVFDLGSNNPVMLALSFARDRGLMRDRRVSTAATATLAGTQIGRTFTLASVALADSTLASPPADAFEEWGVPEAPVNLGLPIFRNFAVALDTAGRKLWLAPVSGPRAGFRRDRSGLGVAFLGDRLRVMHVALNSPAAFGGWREGEEVLAIDGRTVDQDYFASGLEAWRSRPAGVLVRLRGPFGNRRLVLAEYF